MNQCIFVGRITKDLALEKVKVGSDELSLCKFTVATQRNRKNKEGKYDADFHFCTAWRQTAEYLAKYAGKGTLVSVVCQHNTQTYEKDGKKLTSSNFVVTEAHVLQGKSASQDEASAEAPDIEEVTDVVAEDVASTDIGADDLPF